MNGGETTSSSPRAAPWPWLVAVAMAAVAVWLGARYAIAAQENAVLRDQRALAEVALKSLESQADAERLLSARLAAMERLQVRVLTARAGAPGTAVVVWDPARQAGVLHAAGLRPLAGNRVYAAWILDTPPVRVGTLTVDANGRGQTAVTANGRAEVPAKFGISEEASAPPAEYSASTRLTHATE